jgi:hypothetical protein
MKKTVFVFCVVLLAAASAYAVGVPAPQTPRLMVDDAGALVSTTNPLPVAISGMASGAYTVSTLSVTLEGPTGFATDPVYFKDAKSTVASPTRYATNLSTSTPTLLSAIASWTLPCSLQIQTNAVAFYDAATTTAATVWAGQRMAQYDTVWISPSSVSFNMSFIASSSANASLSVLVWPTSY